MPQAILGSTHTFQVLFIDENGQHLAGITDAAIDIFKMDASGAKVTLISTAMAPAVPAEDGRFVYPFVLSSTLVVIGDTLYAEYTGTDPIAPTVIIRTEEPLDVIADPSDLGGRVIAQFVKGG
jgi:hypothetical protein